MKTWHLISPNELKPFEAPDPIPKNNEAKIKISNVLLDAMDLAVFNGSTTASYPLIPGRFAVGKISLLPEGYEGMLEKGNRVFINPFLPDRNFSGDSTPLQGMESVKICGMTENGFLAPYATTPIDNLCALPESVPDDKALYIYLIALAVSAIDALGEIKGKYIVVFGGTALGLVLCQMLCYYQAVPILVDSRTARLDFARRSGVTYAFLNDDNLDAHLNSITGAAFADGAVYVPSGSSIVNTAVFRTVGPKKHIVFCGFAAESLQVNLGLAMRKELHIFGVSDPTENIATAINLLANKAINVNIFANKVYSIGRLEQAYDETAKNDNDYPHEVISIIDCYGQL